MQDSLLHFPICQDYGQDMKLRDDDKKWLADEISVQVELTIAKAIDKFNPHGWRRVTDFIRSWGIAGAVITVFVGLLALAAGAFYQATARVKEDVSFRTHTEDRLTGIEASLLKINATLEGSKLKQIGSNPTNPENIAEVKNVLTAVRASRTKLDPTIVKDVGVKFVREPLNYSLSLQAGML